MSNPNQMSADVLEFMLKMEQFPNPLAGFARTPPKDLDLATVLMFGTGDGSKKGEIFEARDAWKNFVACQTLEHLTEFVDGALDSIYVLLWTMHKLGVPIEACWNEVQRSNMTKLDPATGKPLRDPETGKIQKPAGWTPPNLFDIIQSAASEAVYEGGIAKHS